LSELLLYGLDESGETTFTQQLRDADRGQLKALAHDRLKCFARVEVWDGPMCVLRLRRDPLPQT
jgi:hypothetical protein